MKAAKRFQGGVTRAKRERLAHGLKAKAVCAVAGIRPARLSLAEAGLTVLRPEEEAARQFAVRFLSEAAS